MRESASRDQPLVGICSAKVTSIHCAQTLQPMNHANTVVMAYEYACVSEGILICCFQMISE